MKRPVRSVFAAVAPAAVALLLCAGASSLAAQGAEHHTLVGDDVAIYNLAGMTRVEPGTGRDVVVLVSRQGADAAALRIRTEHRAAGDALWVLFDGDRLVYPDMAGRRDSVVIRVRGDRFEAGRVGLFSGRTVQILREGRAPIAHADITVRVPAGKRVAVHAAAGEVVVRNVEANLFLGTVFAPVRAERTRGVLRVEAHSAAVTVRGAEGMVTTRTREGGVAVVGFRGSRLVVRTSAGSASGSDIAATGVDILTQAGSIVVRRVQAERLVLDSGAGPITGVDLDAESLDVEIEAGDIELDGVRAPDLRLDTGKGDIRLRLRGDVRSLVIDAGGAVRVWAPPELDADLVVESGTGTIAVELPADGVMRTRSHFTGRIGRGSGRITIDADAGVRVGPLVSGSVFDSPGGHLPGRR